MLTNYTVFHKQDIKKIISRSPLHSVRNSLIRPKFQDYIFPQMDPNYESELLAEKFNFKKHIGYTEEEYFNMPIHERRYMVILHNQKVEQEEAAMKGNAPISVDVAQVQEMSANAKR